MQNFTHKTWVLSAHFVQDCYTKPKYVFYGLRYMIGQNIFIS